MKWISVKDELPENSGNFLATDGDITTELYFEKRQRCHLWLESSGKPSEPIDDITHWMPLPKPPTKQGI